MPSICPRASSPDVFARPATRRTRLDERVEHQRVVVHGSPPVQRGGCRRACAASTTAPLAMRDRRLSARLVK
jgi:hypothetical protein